MRIGLQLFLMLFLASGLCSAPITAQGLKGVPDTKILGREPLPNLIPGRNDAERWALFAGHAPRLIGLSKAEIEKIFGTGASDKEQQLVFQITQCNARDKGQHAYIEVVFKLEKKKMFAYTVEAVDWV